MVGFSECVAPVDDWANGGSVDVFLKFAEYVVISKGSWSCSR